VAQNSVFLLAMVMFRPDNIQQRIIIAKEVIIEKVTPWRNHLHPIIPAFLSGWSMVIHHKANSFIHWAKLSA